ncbi:MAG TPA: hypothetical protein PKB15_03290 [Acidimicrobiia bacterium]|nr:hypothetical protein [Acidimicrobiia bacterium]
MSDKITIRKATIEDAPYVFDMLSDMAVILGEEKYNVSFEENRYRCNYFVSIE